MREKPSESSQTPKHMQSNAGESGSFMDVDPKPMAAVASEHKGERGAPIPSMESVVYDILSGREMIVSHRGSSQYALGGGASACGLAGMNAARIILERQHGGENDPGRLIEWLVQRETTEEIMAICASWKGSAHLEVDDIAKTPFFEHSLQLDYTHVSRVGFKYFRNLLGLIKERTNHSAAVIITRPPEIITVLKIVTSEISVFVVFDSHPRPNHPDGAGLIFNTSLDATARQLEMLLPVDESLLRDKTLDWSTQLLAQFSGHFIIARESSTLSDSTRELLMKASLDVLAMRSENAALKDEVTDVKQKLFSAKTEVDGLKGELLRSRDQGRADRARLTRDLDWMRRELAATKSAGPSRGGLLSFMPTWNTITKPTQDKRSYGQGYNHASTSQSGQSSSSKEYERPSTSSSSTQSYPTPSEAAIMEKLKREDRDFMLAAEVQMEWQEFPGRPPTMFPNAGDAAQSRRDEGKRKKEGGRQGKGKEKETYFNRFAPLAGPEVIDLSGRASRLEAADKALGKRREGASAAEFTRNTRHRSASPRRPSAPEHLRVVTDVSRRNGNIHYIDDDDAGDSPQSAPASFCDARESFDDDGTPSPMPRPDLLLPAHATTIKTEEIEPPLSSESSMDCSPSQAEVPPPAYFAGAHGGHSLADEKREHTRKPSVSLLRPRKGTRPKDEPETDEELANAMARELDLPTSKSLPKALPTTPKQQPTIPVSAVPVPLSPVVPQTSERAPAIPDEEDEPEEEDEDTRMAAELQRQFDDEDRLLRDERQALGLGDFEMAIEAPPPPLAHLPNVAGPSQSGSFGFLIPAGPPIPAIPGGFQQFDAEDRKLQTERSSLSKYYNQYVFKCGVCMEDHTTEDVTEFHPCGHRFCRVCVQGYVSSQIASHRYPIPCPECAADKSCTEPSVVDFTLLEVVGTSDPEYDIFLEMQMAAFCIQVHCRKCTKTMFVDRKEHDAAPILTCPLPDCRHSWCKTCQQPVDAGVEHSCDGALELNHLIRDQGWRRCPGCDTPVEKTMGCQHMTCITPGCYTHFCWKCAQLIIKSPMRDEVNAAIGQHYSKTCKLFTYDDIV